mmetsp:Transcript_16739/g.31045  ORF Transcript_16739/g.31045 Transcript_16739/m.31045 type:complete len:100 (-) Transcript_16739:377-676(-)
MYHGGNKADFGNLHKTAIGEISGLDFFWSARNDKKWPIMVNEPSTGTIGPCYKKQFYVTIFYHRACCGLFLAATDVPNNTCCISWLDNSHFQLPSSRIS